MKANIHPKYNSQATVTCVCGSIFNTGSTQNDIHVDICSACHPFFTGEMKFVDIQGRVEKFQNLMKKSSANYVPKKQRRLEKKTQDESKQQVKPQSLTEIIKEN